jgi:hypothetical protein
VLEAALTRYDDTHARDKSLYLSWLADSYLTAGEVEQAGVGEPFARTQAQRSQE